VTEVAAEQAPVQRSNASWKIFRQLIAAFLRERDTFADRFDTRAAGTLAA
jgi:hypothetical protein